VAELLAELLEGLFCLRLRFLRRSVMTSCSYVLPPICMEPKENLSKRIGELLGIMASGALPGRDRGERRPALLDIFAAAVPAGDFSLVMLGDR
jgi:hypothetical protein